MHETFKDYVEAEVTEMLRSMDEKTRCNERKRRLSALAWVRKNAEMFRKKWEDRTGQRMESQEFN